MQLLTPSLHVCGYLGSPSSPQMPYQAPSDAQQLRVFLSQPHFGHVGVGTVGANVMVGCAADFDTRTVVQILTRGWWWLAH